MQSLLIPMVESLVFPPYSTEGMEEFLSNISNTIRAFRLEYGKEKTLRVIQSLGFDGYIPSSVEEMAVKMADVMDFFFIEDY